MQTSKCKQCNNEFNYNPKQKNGLYCSLECTHKAQRQNRHLLYKEGKLTNRPSLKNYVVEERGYKCVMCNNNEWLGNPIVLELDHIDGNASNNLPSNLRLLCPNCHSLTPTHRAKNKGNGRKARGLQYW